MKQFQKFQKFQVEVKPESNEFSGKTSIPSSHVKGNPMPGSLPRKSPFGTISFDNFSAIAISRAGNFLQKIGSKITRAQAAKWKVYR